MNLRMSEPACITSDGISTTRLFVWLGAVIFICVAVLYGQLDRIEDIVRSDLGGAGLNLESDLGSLDHELGFDRLERSIAGLFYRESSHAPAKQITKRNWKIPRSTTYVRG
jgi:hypothetical protein